MNVDLYPTAEIRQNCDFDGGPLVYGDTHHVNPEEMGVWHDYVFTEVDRRGPAADYCAAIAGGSSIWGANSLDGGSPIKHTTLTDRSLVSHTWTNDDCEDAGGVVPIGDARRFRASGACNHPPNASGAIAHVQSDTLRPRIGRLLDRGAAKARNRSLSA